MPDDSLTYVGNFISEALESTEQGGASKNAAEGKSDEKKAVGDIYGEFFTDFDLLKLYEQSYNWGIDTGEEAEERVNKWIDSFIPSWSAMLIGFLAVGLIILGAWAMLGGSSITVNTSEGD